MIRVGVIADIFEVGGQERGCLEVLRRLDRRRFTPHLYVFRPGALLADVAALGVPIVVGHDKPGYDSAWTEADDAAKDAWRERLATSLRRDRIDVCLVYAWRDALPAAAAAGIGAVVERVDGPALTGRIRDKSGFTRIICESRLGRTVLLAQRGLFGCRREQITVVPNGIDLARFDPAAYDRARSRERLGLKQTDFVVGTVGRLSPEKNVEQLIDAVPLFQGRSRKAAHIQVVIAGPDCGIGPALQARCERLGIADRVRFVGARDDVPEVLAALDVYVLTSLYEGTPFALLEAMAMGLPIVANQAGAVIEVVRGNGFLVPLLQPEDTARALVELAADPELGRRLGRRSRALAVARYDIGRMITRYEEVLLDALAAAAPRTAARAARLP